MVNITIDKHRLLTELGVTETEEFLHKIVMLGVEIDDNTPTQLLLNVTPNRPDLLSQPGITRALAAFFGSKPGLRTYTTTPSKLKVTVDESVRGIRPYTACAVARGLNLDDERLREIIEIQEKLHVTFCRRRKRAAIGIYPLSAIQGNITYTAMEPDKIKFRPLETAGEMTATEILTEHPKGREYAHLLAGLPRYAIFFDSKKNILSMPPIINSHETGKVTLDTNEVFIEASGSDFSTCRQIVQMISCALADMGASIHTVEVVYGRKSEITPDLRTQRQPFSGYYIERRLGVSIKPDELPQLLAKMGLGLEPARGKDSYNALLPPYRTDFLHQIDVVEDVAIAYGYERITAQMPNVATVGGESSRTMFERAARETLVGYGLLEAKNYHLLGGALQQAVDGVEPDGLVRLKSSASDEYNTMRRTLLTGMLVMLSRNKTHEYPQELFELGSAFAPAAMRVDETQHACVTLAGRSDYTRARQIIDGLLAAFGLSATYAPIKDVRFLQGRCASVAVDGTVIGVVGEVAPRVLSAVSLTVPVAAGEIDMDAVRALTKQTI